MLIKGVNGVNGANGLKLTIKGRKMAGMGSIGYITPLFLWASISILVSKMCKFSKYHKFLIWYGQYKGNTGMNCYFLAKRIHSFEKVEKIQIYGHRLALIWTWYIKWLIAYIKYKLAWRKLSQKGKKCNKRAMKDKMWYFWT